MTNLSSWRAKQTNPETIFDAIIADVREWADMPDLTSGELMFYAGFKYDNLVMTDYPKTEVTALTRLWHNVNYYHFETIAQTTKFEYNPINNYDRTEERTKINSPLLTESTELTRTPNITRTDTESGTTGRSGTTSSSGTSDVVGSVAPYDSSTFAPRDKSESETSGSLTEAETVTHGKTITDRETGTDRTDTTVERTGTDTTEETTHISGNIGVTTTQDMIEQERAVANFAFLDYYLQSWARMITTGVFLTDF